MKKDLLHVIGAYYNFRRSKTPRQLFHEWIDYQLDSGVSLTIVEFALGERPYELNPDDPKLAHARLLQLRGRSQNELWIRDALVNWGIAHLPDDAKYVCWDDTDLRHARPDWAVETVHMLQHYRVGQTWSHSVDLGPQHEIVPNDWNHETDRSFCWAWLQGDVEAPKEGYAGTLRHQSRALFKNKKQTDWRAHTGYSWAIRRDALNGIGGLLDWMVTGSSDWHMALAFAGYLQNFDERMTPGYTRRLKEFVRLCDLYIQQDIGCVPGMIQHHWHGRKKDRQYLTRFDVLLESSFDPDVDLVRDVHGVPSLTGDNRLLRDGLRRLIGQMRPDSIDTE
ncbi:hypothetical protein RZS28_09385 [Methylocapsa polymorpha]|uniref:Uncharacterized protein n=1 Tax=Methylocapsa polymorpha TaxID=3080828 RepID=A0ABZ0HMU8_9HYPH|nr:hypothetical protein RZS28_09385 [Methylocapsa sp. RX1]